MVDVTYFVTQGTGVGTRITSDDKHWPVYSWLLHILSDAVMLVEVGVLVKVEMVDSVNG